MSKITEELDCIAGELEPQDPRLALAIDQISDYLDYRTAKVEWPFIERFLKDISPVLENIKNQARKIREPSDVAKTIKDNAENALKHLDKFHGTHNPLLQP